MKFDHHLAARATVAASIAALASATASANPYDCLIEPNQTVEIRSPVEGVIKSILVQRGDRVRAGQLLVQLDSALEATTAELARYRSELSGRLAAAKSRLEYATRKSERSTELHAQNFVAAQVRDEADAERRVTEAELRDAQENLELAKHEHRQAIEALNRRSLRSPFDGVVMERMLNPGDLAEAGTGRKPILKLAQVEPLRVEVVLPLAAYGKLKKNSSAEVTPEGMDRRYVATVSVIDSVFDSASGTFGVRLKLPNAAGTLPAGIRCRADFAALRGLTGAPVGSKATPSR